MSVLELKGITKRFGKFTAVEEVSFEIREGEVFGFIGPNGAGKSTTIRAIIGAISPTSGEVRLHGKPVTAQPDYRKHIAYVPGDVQLWPNLTGGEVIRFFMEMSGNADTEKMETLIREFRLDPKKKCKTYSKGNRQKVALISAFLSDADLLIFDEPTTGLDPLMERTFHRHVLSAKSEGKSILLSSHILSEVEKLADRIAIIREGKIIETGRFSELKHITRVHYLVRTPEDLAAVGRMEGVHEFRQEGGEAEFLVDADRVKDVLAALKRYELEGLETLPPKLEDIFMRYYDAGSGAS
ncbi:putative ABC transporter ATP-binding protein YbhF [Bhargavaea cecembensis DSE10]|uniref:Putative ABC transporter ATP-binding protein YbhF n=1 Tax=Bhargavaea cecembensis DSE10 TaxID=1235279 RepID=M7NCS6_9BACL|nr:ABC transporter ATP-binding protein [Bhargavaea cecembensis]EMR06373.1 putative ABC transporter ATP-binding protein YbhF [Bhargavaea cecembensis DSE10]